MIENTIKDDKTVADGGNGGGFVFDCRAMPNPFWDESLRGYTGRDKPIADFFACHKDKVDCFLGAAETIIRQSIDEYLKDGKMVVGGTWEMVARLLTKPTFAEIVIGNISK